MAQVTIKQSNLGGGVLGDLSREWCSRPADERITGPDSWSARLEIEKQATEYAQRSKALTVHSHAIKVEKAGTGLAVRGQNGGIAYPTHWAMTQLCQRAGVPASYLRESLSDNPDLAAQCLNYGLQHRDDDRVGMLLTLKGESARIAACTSPTYGRIWNFQVLQAVNKHLGPEWTVPGIFGKAVSEITKQNTSLFLSSQDMFIGLSDERNKVEIPNRREGKKGAFSRFILLGNSEVGAAKLIIKGGYFDYACANRNLWGVEDITEINIRHTSGAPDRWLWQALPSIKKFMQAGTGPVLRLLEAARSTKIPDPLEFLTKHFTRPAAKAIIEIHKDEEHRPIETLWDAEVGATAYARTLPWQDERLKIETIAGGFMPKA